MNIRLILSGLAAGAALCAIPGAGGAQIFVTNFLSGTIGEYDATTGATINSALVSGLSDPTGLAVFGGNLLVANQGNGTIGEYTTSGATVNAALVSGLNNPVDVAVSGGNLFVTNGFDNTIGEYTTSGATVNAALVSGLNVPFGLAVSGGKLFVVNEGNGTIGEYDAVTGATINSALVSGLIDPRFIALSGAHLFVSDNGNATVGECDAVTGAAINNALISFPFFFGPRGITLFGGNLLIADAFNNSITQFTTSGVEIDFSSGDPIFAGLSGPEEIVVVPTSVPDASSTWALLLLGLTATFSFKPLLLRSA